MQQQHNTHGVEVCAAHTLGTPQHTVALHDSDQHKPMAGTAQCKWGCGMLRVLTQVLLSIAALLLATCLHRSWVFKTWREYFHFSYLNEATLDPEKTYIFVEFPHGVFPMSELIAGETVPRDCVGYSNWLSSRMEGWVVIWRGGWRAADLDFMMLTQ